MLDGPVVVCRRFWSLEIRGWPFSRLARRACAGLVLGGFLEQGCWGRWWAWEVAKAPVRGVACDRNKEEDEDDYAICDFFEMRFLGQFVEIWLGRFEYRGAVVSWFLNIGVGLLDVWLWPSDKVRHSLFDDFWIHNVGAAYSISWTMGEDAMARRSLIGYMNSS